MRRNSECQSRRRLVLKVSHGALVAYGPISLNTAAAPSSPEATRVNAR